MELLELSTGTELSLCNMHSSKIWSLCTCFYVVGSATSVFYVRIGRYCIAGTFGGQFNWQMPTFCIWPVLYL